MSISNANPDMYINNMSKGLKMVGRGDEQSRKGQAIVTVAMVLYAKAMRESADPSAYNMLIRNVAGIHVNAKDQPETFANAWNYWRSIFNHEIKFDLADTKEEEDVTERRELNAPRQSHVRTLRTATSVTFALDHAKLDWNDVRELPKNNDTFALTQGAALLVWPKKDKTIGKAALGVMVDTFGSFNFKSLKSLGDEALIAAKVKKPARTATTKARPVRDVVEAMGNDVENADAKAFDKTTRLKSFEALIKLIDALNDKSVEGRLFDPSIAPFRAYVEKRIVEETVANVQTAKAA